MKHFAPACFLLLALLLSSCHVGRFFAWNMPDVKDQERFPAAPVAKGAAVWELPTSSKSEFDFEQIVTIPRGKAQLDKLMKRTGTAAFIVIQNDSVIVEQYYAGFEDSSPLPSFSVSKSFVSAMLGIALDEGKIGSLSDPIGKYVPEFKHEDVRSIPLEAVLDMQSGIRFSEVYPNPFSDVVKHYYGKNLERHVLKLRAAEEPGKHFRYKSVNTQILAMVLENAYQKPLPALLEEKLWSPMGMEFDATWNLDSEETETVKAFCCLNARARDYARFGVMYLNGGRANGQQVVPESWVNATFNYDYPKNRFRYNKHLWTSKKFRTVSDTTDVDGLFVLNPRKRQKPGEYHLIQQGGAVVAQGILGQTVYMRPEDDLVIVRLGKRNGWFLWANVCYQIALSMQPSK